MLIKLRNEDKRITTIYDKARTIKLSLPPNHKSIMGLTFEWQEWFYFFLSVQWAHINKISNKNKKNPILKKTYLPNFDREIREVLTANESSIGSSGGTTEVKIRVHSKNSLYLFLFSSSDPEIYINIGKNELQDNTIFDCNQKNT